MCVRKLPITVSLNQENIDQPNLKITTGFNAQTSLLGFGGVQKTGMGVNFTSNFLFVYFLFFLTCFLILNLHLDVFFVSMS